jgi:hypothetical protein
VVGPVSGSFAPSYRTIQNADMHCITTWDTVTVYSDRLAGADWSARAQSAINQLPASGGIVDSRNDSDISVGGSTIINPGSKAVTLLLGPHTYYVGNSSTNNYLELQPNLRILGSSKSATTITTGSTTQAPIVSSSTATMTSVNLKDFTLSAPAGSAASQNGIWLSINPSNQGMWYSLWDSINVINFGGVQIFFDGSGGGDGAAGGVGDHQFNSFINVNAYRKNVSAWVNGTSYVAGNTVTINNGACTTYADRTAYTPGKMVWYGSNGMIYVCIANTTGNAPTSATYWAQLTQLASAQTYICTKATSSAIPGTTAGASFWTPYHSEALYIHGASGQNTFINCEIGSQFGSSNSGINITLDCVSNPNFNVNYSNKFIKLTCQFAALGIYVTGGITIHFDSLHAEALYGVLLEDYNPTVAIGITGLRISDGHLLTGCGVNGGAGYIASLTSNTTNTGLNVNQSGDFTFIGNNIYGTPDNLIMGNGTFQTIIRENSSASSGSTIGVCSGVMPTIAAATVVDCGRAKVVAINGSTPITTILSILQPGEMITFFALNGTINFATGGNLALGSALSKAISQNGTATFICHDGSSLSALVQDFALVSVAT